MSNKTIETVSMSREHYNAVRRVLKLLDGYMSTQVNPDTLMAWQGGCMTWTELRQHANAAIKLLPRKQ